MARLRTFALAASGGDLPVACPMFRVGDPVTGALAGSASDPREPIWLVDPAGKRVSVVWPRGFSVRFEPLAVLYDERGRAVARQGDTVVLGQVSVRSHAGTFEDPYEAIGLVFKGCYQPA